MGEKGEVGSKQLNSCCGWGPWVLYVLYTKGRKGVGVGVLIVSFLGGGGGAGGGGGGGGGVVASSAVSGS